MLPIGPLMIEHRLIQRMINLLRRETERMERDQTINAAFLDTVVDFIETYADRLHHGKEEGILFRELDGKSLTEEHRRILRELKEEHLSARKAVTELSEAAARSVSGKKEALPVIIKQARFLVDAYPRHIDKEEHHFFIPCMKYLSSEEKDAMLEQESEFDRNVIHELYKEKVAKQEAKAAA